jgi:putative NADH-flavin reductase
MKVAIIGATGKTGYQTMLKALDLGHSVTAVVRDPGSIHLQHERLQLNQADVMERLEMLEDALTGQEAVISTIGISTGLNSKISLYSKGTANIIKAMHKKGVKRLTLISSIGIDETRDPNVPFIFQDVFFPLIFSNSAADMREMEKNVTSSNLNWTIARSAGLVNKPPSWQYRVVIAPSLPRPYTMGRADLADFMIKQLGNPEYFNKIVSLAY